MKLFFCHVVHLFSLAFDGELFADDFKYLIDMLDTIVDIDIKHKEESIK